MNKNKFFLILLTMVLLNFCVFAQNDKDKRTPDLSGKWILDKEKSLFSYGVPNNNSSDKENYEDYTLVISQKDLEIEILQSYRFKGKQSDYKIILVTDKRGEENICPHRDYYFHDLTKKTFRLEDVNMKSKTQWTKNKLKRRATYKPELSHTNHILDQIYELSSDGKTLTITDDLTLMIESELVDKMFKNQKSKLVFQKEN